MKKGPIKIDEPSYDYISLIQNQNFDFYGIFALLKINF